MINVVDREPTYPGRVRLEKEDGSVEFVTLKRADEPTVEGTPINKALFDSIQNDIGLPLDITVYVSKAGSDALGTGEYAKPYESIGKALEAIPKNLNGHIATVNIGNGTYPETVRIDGFHGGTIVFTGNDGADVAVSNLFLNDKSIVEIKSIRFTASSGYISVVDGAILVAYSDVLANGALYGVNVAYGGQAIFNAGLSINNTTGNAVNASSGGFVYVSALSGAGNRLGIATASGSTVVYETITIGATSGFFVASGGRILSGSQMSIPNY